MAEYNCDLELTVMDQVVRSLSHASLNDEQKKRIIQYVQDRFIRKEPPSQQSAYLQQGFMKAKGLG